MKLQHASYKAYYDTDKYIPVFYNWEWGMVDINYPGCDGWHDLHDAKLPHYGVTTEHLKEIVERETGKKVRRLVAW